MERNPEQLHETPDAIALGTMRLRHHNEIIAYREDGGIDALRFIKTGEVAVRSFMIGNKTTSYEYEVEEPLIEASYDSWRDYAVAAGSDISGNKENVTVWRGNSEHDPRYDDVRDAIMTAASERLGQLEDTERIEPCRRNCEAGMYTHECMCLQLQSSYTFIDGETLREPKQIGEPDPNCSDCHGEGTATIRCYECLGSGKEIINPLVSIINNATGESTTFRLEAVDLLTDTDTILMVQDERQRSIRGQVQPSELRIAIDIENFMRRKALEVGIDITDDYTTYWGPQQLETFGTTFGHLLQQMSANVALPETFASELEFTDAALREIQRALNAHIRTDIYGVNRQRDPIEAIQAEGKLFDIDFNDDLTVSYVGLRLDKPMSPDTALRELIGALGRRGYRLGFTYTGIATGESGPALYVLDKNGMLLSEIESGYEDRTVLQNAHDRIDLLLEARSEQGDDEPL